MNKKSLIGAIIIVLVLAVIGVYFFLESAKTKVEKVYRLGILSGLDAFSPMADGFKLKMAELGYVEGKNIIYDLQKTNMDPAEIDEILKKFMADKVDLIFTFPTEPALAAKTITQGTNIPVVFASANIEGIKLVESVSQPGGNITGSRYPGPDLAVKRFELLRELMPQLKRLGIIYNTNYPANAPALEVLRPAVSAASVTLAEVPVTTLEEITANLQARTDAKDIGMDAILIMPDDLTQSPLGWEMVTKFADAHKIPIAGSASFEADTGAVFSYIPDNIETGKLAAPLADKILKGAPAGTIMVVTPPSYLRLNYRKAQELGFAVPQSLLDQASEIIR